MFHLSNLKSLAKVIDTLPNNLQSVRWRRKPRWLPVAKSKMFKVPPRTVTPEEEKLELMRLNNNYRTQMKAVRSYLHNEYNVKSVIIDTEEHNREFMEEFEKSMKINDAWNEERRIVREARHAKELEEAKQIAFARLDERLKIRETELRAVEDIVRKEKEAAKNFITADNVDTAIEHALANIIDYNYSIDLDGNIYHGRNAKPESPHDKQAKSALSS